MSILDNASQSVIHGGQFTNVLQGDAHFHIGSPRASGNQGLALLHMNVATGAFHDAVERGDPPKCHPQTRVAILDEIQDWAQDVPEGHKKLILWLYGPAGSGKSAIAQTIAEIFAKRGLVASFFFSRTAIGRNNTTQFIASIAYQLSVYIPEARVHIAMAVEQDPLVFSRTLLSQMDALVIQPLNAAAATLVLPNTTPRLVIVDGLDEAHNERTQTELLDALTTAVQRIHIPLLFLVASRPEYAIRQAFNRQPLRSLMRGLALDENYQPDNDVRIFFSAKFSEIRESHPSGHVLPVPWPTQEDINYLVFKASGQFIYASTVMKYINSPRDNPKRQLKIVLGLCDPGKDTPFAQLDALYQHILLSVKDISRVLEILSLVLLYTGQYGFLSIDFIEVLLGYDSGDVIAALTDMHALIHVPSSGGGNDGRPLHIYHASLHDFLLDKSRSGSFFLDASVRHADLARHFLRYFTTAHIGRRVYVFLNEFIAHFLKACHTEELLADLMKFSLTTFLANCRTPEILFETRWNAFFYHLRSQCSETDEHPLYQRLKDEFDTWIRNQYERYPQVTQNFISAAFAMPDKGLPTFTVDIRNIFNILSYDLISADAARVMELDREGFCFQHISLTSIDTLYNFFTDSSRAGIHFAKKAGLGKLAEGIVKVLCQRYYRYEEWPPIFLDDGLEFFTRILGAASEDLKLARLLWMLAVQYNDNDVNRQGKKTIANACLDYIKRCGIYLPEHVHEADCTICANFQPIFPTPCLESDEEITKYIMPIPNKKDASIPRHIANSLANIPPLSPPDTQSNPDVVASSSSYPRSPDVGRSLTATLTGPTNAPSPPSSFLLSPLATRSASTRLSSAGPSTPSHRPRSNSLSADFSSQTSNTASNSDANDLSSARPSASAIIQRLASDMCQRTYGQSSKTNAAASARAVPPQPSSKNFPKKPAWR